MVERVVKFQSVFILLQDVKCIKKQVVFSTGGERSAKTAFSLALFGCRCQRFNHSPLATPPQMLLPR